MMKFVHSDARKLLSTGILFTAIVTLMFAGTEQAFASPGPAHSGNPPLLEIIKGGSGQMRIQSTAVPNTIGGEIAVYSDESVTFVGANGCPLPGPVTGAKDRLVDNAGVLVGYKLAAAGDFVQFPWGLGLFINAGDVSTSVGGKLVKTGTNTAVDFPIHWEEVNDGNLLTADDTSNITPVPDTYSFASCGTEGVNNKKYQDQGGYEIVQPVGGSILPIDAAALLIAGAFTNAIWMAPVLAGAAGTAAFYLKTRKN